jgi:SAM-dependent methyltransferase
MSTDASDRVARRYRASSADEYFEWQSGIGRLGADLNRWKVERYLHPDDTVLDFGCGGGYLLGALPVARKLGVEVSPRASEIATQNGLDVVSSLGEVPSSAVDVVISHAVLDHTLNPFAELKELFRVLRPGGRLVLWTPIDDWRDRRSRQRDPNFRMYTWTPPLMRNLLDEAGFDEIETAVSTYAWSLRFARYRHRMPMPIFRLACRFTSIVLHRRELRSIAVKPSVARPELTTGEQEPAARAEPRRQPMAATEPHAERREPERDSA